MEIKDKKHTVTANEINKFCYCPYQWYYERVYGRKELSLMKKELNSELGLTDSRLSNFKKGSEFHSRVKFNRWLKVKKIALILFIILLIAIGVYIRMKYFG
ncbi:MAG: helix-turn-helix domain-containing protein [Clostridia bacterium]|jgi:DNA-binding Xre family transcriptional regulator|nr:helix-turn-helix domain-containing protein [Clostridia bacterium]MCI2001173.1 helix-turn-helix domain-containing protein [Clostridia bacterium]MCI2015863.1 helix-turn-helix domain-containing protein [Clostridia bacterium]